MYLNLGTSQPVFKWFSVYNLSLRNVDIMNSIGNIILFETIKHNCVSMKT